MWDRYKTDVFDRTGTFDIISTPVEQLTPEQVEELQQRFAALCEGLQQITTPLLETIAAHVQYMLSLWAEAWEQTLYPPLHDAYLADGAPYGDTMDGLLQWLKEARFTTSTTATIDATHDDLDDLVEEPQG